jgi:CBS-domain-containing membrane protein
MKTTLLRLIWVSIGAGVAITLTLLATKAISPLLLASLGGTTLFLFGLSTTPAAQPRAVWGGHLSSSLIGIICVQCLGDAAWVSVTAVVITICVLLLTRTVHPPAGANPLIMIQAHASFSHIGLTVLLGISIISVVAWIWSRLGFGTKKYPVSWSQPSPPTMNWSIWGD